MHLAIGGVPRYTRGAVSTPRLSIGPSDFAALRKPGVLLVDKSALIREIVEDPYQTLVFPRPRRFGKSTNLSMLGYFLGKSSTDRSALFRDLAIWRWPEAPQHFQRYPLLLLTFKDLKEATWTACLAHVKALLAEIYGAHADAAEAITGPADAVAFDAVLRGTPTTLQAKDALRKLSQHLHRRHQQPVVILIDEYDTALHEAFARGYYREAVDFFRGMLSGALKDNGSLFKGVLTGILSIARRRGMKSSCAPVESSTAALRSPCKSMFSGLNNLGVYSLLKQRYATAFGFTELEVEDLRYRLGAPNSSGSAGRNAAPSMDALRRWYEGYLFGGQVIYNPWSLLNALACTDEPLQPYWANTASEHLISELLLRHGGGQEGELEALLRGEGIRKQLREDTDLSAIYRDPDALWSFLLYTGYLKAQDVTVQVADNRSQTVAMLQVPNLEVATVFTGLIERWLQDGAGGEQRRQQMIRALLRGDLETFQQHLQRILLKLGSFHDLSGKRHKMPPEHAFQVFILGLLVSLPRHRVTANREGGHGRYGVLIASREPGGPGIVLELKVKAKGTMERALSAARQQLRDRDHAELRAQGAAPLQVAVAFDGKRVLVASADEHVRL